MIPAEIDIPGNIGRGTIETMFHRAGCRDDRDIGFVGGEGKIACLQLFKQPGK